MGDSSNIKKMISFSNKNSTNLGIIHIAVAIPLILASYFAILYEPAGSKNYVFAWIGICFFGLAIPIGLYEIFNKRQNIIINPKDILLSGLTTGGLMIFSIKSNLIFVIILIISGIAGIISRWYQGTKNKSNIYKYSKIITLHGFANIVFILLIFHTYDIATKSIAKTISTEIENYKIDNKTYPKDIEPFYQHLNIFQKYLMTKIKYSTTDSCYQLQLETLRNNQELYNKEQNKWE